MAAVVATVRAAVADTDVGRAVREGRRAVALAQHGAEGALVAALAAYARALYLAGDADAAWDTALQAVEHPQATRRAPDHAFARSTLAIVAADRGRLETARIHAAAARSLPSGLGSSRCWLGANAMVAAGVVHLPSATALRPSDSSPPPSTSSATRWKACTTCGCCCCSPGPAAFAGGSRTPRRTAARRPWRSASWPDPGLVPWLAVDVGREIARSRSRAATGELLEPPSRAELAVLRLLDSELSVREIGEQLYLSANTVRTHTRAIYRKFNVNSRAEAVARADALGLFAESDSHG